MTARTPTPTTRLSISESTALIEVKRLAKRSAEVVTFEINKSRAHAQAGLAEALLCGSQLLRARSILGKAGFDLWLSKNFPELHPDVARTYLTLAKSSSHDETLSTQAGRRDALIALGILE